MALEQIVDKHLTLLARKHLETKFCKISAEKCPFLTGAVYCAFVFCHTELICRSFV